MRRLGSDARGVVYAEFIMAFTPFFLLFLGTIQIAFIATGSIVVQTAASKAARAAMVVLAEDPFFYENEKALLLDFNGKSDNSGFQKGLADNLDKTGVSVPNMPAGQDQNLTSGFGGAGGKSKGGGGQSSSQESGNAGPRLNEIRLAAYVTLAPLAPSYEMFSAWLAGGAGIGGISGLGGLSVLKDKLPELPTLGGGGKNPFSLKKTAIGENPLIRFLIGFGAYNSVAAAVNFPVAPWKPELRNGGKDFKGQVTYRPGEKVTVRVAYLFPCGVPLVNMIVCRQLPMNDDDGLLDELKAGVQNSSLLEILKVAENARFYVMHAEATMPIQYAGYCYPTEKDCKP
jgi:hypothetical protein